MFSERLRQMLLQAFGYPELVDEFISVITTGEIEDNSITDAQLIQIASATFKGRTTSGLGNVETLTAAQATAILNSFTTTLKGLVPAPGSSPGTTFLRDDGAWASVGGGMSVGGAISGGTDTRVLFDDAGVLGEDSAFTWNKTTDFLTVANINALTAIGINNATPKSALTSGYTFTSNSRVLDIKGVDFASSGGYGMLVLRGPGDYFATSEQTSGGQILFVSQEVAGNAYPSGLLEFKRDGGYSSGYFSIQTGVNGVLTETLRVTTSLNRSVLDFRAAAATDIKVQGNLAATFGSTGWNFNGGITGDTALANNDIGSDGTNIYPFRDLYIEEGIGLGYTSGESVVTIAAGTIKVKTGTPLTLDADQVVTTASIGATAPSYSFVGATNKGMYSSGANQLAFAVDGIKRMVLTRFSAGAPNRPMLDLTSPDNVAAYIAFDGAWRIGMSNTLIDFAVPINPVGGSIANPGLVFSDDVDTGISRSAANTIDISTGGVSRLTATSNGVRIQGSITNDSAAAGDVGQRIVTAVPVGSGVTLTTATPASIASISLTAGDWDVSAVGGLNGSLTGTQFIVAIGETNNSLAGTTPGDDQISTPTTSLVGSDSCLTLPAVRKSFSTTTTVYMIQQATFTVGTGVGYGRISARRVR